MKKYVFAIIIVLIVLFYLSSMPYQQQTLVPSLKLLLKDQPFKDLLSKVEVSYWGQTISVETRGYFYFVEFLIRKAFHFVGFGFIAIVVYLLFRKMKLRWSALFAIVTTFIIASLDELRQFFVPGRTGVFKDVLLDTAGAITFIYLLKFIILLKQKKLSKLHY